MDGWKIDIRERVATLLTDIWIWRTNREGNTEIWHDAGVTYTRKHSEESSEEKILPTLTIPTDLLEVLLQTIIARGVKPPAESYVKGKLEATENHLEDLRSLLKLPSQSITENKGRPTNA